MLILKKYVNTIKENYVIENFLVTKLQIRQLVKELKLNEFSIIIITYNSVKLFKEFRFIISQSFNDYQVVVIDNNSTDETVNIIKNNIKISNF